MNPIPTHRPDPHAARLAAEVLRENKDAIFGFVWRRVGSDRHAAEDVTQEALLSFWGYWKKRGPFTRKEAAKLLYDMAGKRVIDWRRKKQRTPVPTEDDLLLEHFSRRLNSDPAERVVSRMELQRVFGALNERQRTVLIRRFVDGWDRASIAESMGVKPDTVKYHLAAALTRARELLELGTFDLSPAERRHRGRHDKDDR